MLQAAAGGNMHAFTAVSSCAVLDLLAPPYDTNDRTHSQLPVTCRKDRCLLPSLESCMAAPPGTCDEQPGGQQVVRVLTVCTPLRS